jgi:hypothetical protein
VLSPLKLKSLYLADHCMVAAGRSRDCRGAPADQETCLGSHVNPGQLGTNQLELGAVPCNVKDKI